MAGVDELEEQRDAIVADGQNERPWSQPAQRLQSAIGNLLFAAWRCAKRGRAKFLSASPAANRARPLHARR